MVENNKIENTKRNIYIHDIKGPAQLPSDAIIDIVQSRPLKGARKLLADKYGVSEHRIYKIWHEYYGSGTKLAYKTGLKKALPNDQILNNNDNMRKIKTERGVYITQEPKTEMVNLRQKATPIRKIQATPQSKQMNINDLNSITSEQAEILSGEVMSGNDNNELINAINQLTISNQNLSEHAINSLNKARKYAKKNYGTSNIDDSGYDTYEPESIDDWAENENADDSTIVYKKVQPPIKTIKKQPRQRDTRGLYNTRGDISSERIERIDPLCESNILYEEPIRRRVRSISENERVCLPTSGSRSRAQPLFTAYPETGSETDDLQQYPISNIGYEPKISRIERDSGKTNIQPNNTHNNSKQYQEPRQSESIYNSSGNRSEQTKQILHSEIADPRFPWLLRRK